MLWSHSMETKVLALAPQAWRRPLDRGLLSQHYRVTWTSLFSGGGRTKNTPILPAALEVRTHTVATGLMTTKNVGNMSTSVPERCGQRTWC